jgi:hypothetical protein
MERGPRAPRFAFSPSAETAPDSLADAVAISLRSPEIFSGGSESVADGSVIVDATLVLFGGLVRFGNRIGLGRLVLFRDLNRDACCAAEIYADLI